MIRRPDNFRIAISLIDVKSPQSMGTPGSVGKPNCTNHQVLRVSMVNARLARRQLAACTGGVDAAALHGLAPPVASAASCGATGPPAQDSQSATRTLCRADERNAVQPVLQ
jgi:hypothetical protein